MLVLTTLFFVGCGGNSYNTGSAPPLILSGNWQFSLAPPADGSFLGGLQGGFLLAQNGAVTGGADYAVFLTDLQYPCNTGTATITGTISGANVSLTAVAGTQTFTLTGVLNPESTAMSGTYSSTAGSAGDGSPCGTAQSGLQWSAASVPTMTGSIQGSFHSSGGTAGLGEQEFLVSGSLIQGDNTGASSAPVTGTLNFLNSVTNKSDYPCIATAALQGQISGDMVMLQILGSDGTAIGQIGTQGSSNLDSVTFAPAQGGYILSSVGSPAYAVYASACGGGSIESPADYGNLCLALNSTTGCSQPITLVPPALSFSPQAVGTSAAQSITLTDSTSATLDNLTISLSNNSAANGFTETDNCGAQGSPSAGQPFILLADQSCVITVTFAPTCAVSCPASVSTTLALNVPGIEAIFTLPITGVPQLTSNLEPGATRDSDESCRVSEARKPRLDFDQQPMLVHSRGVL